MTDTSSAYESMFVITSCAGQVFMTHNHHGSPHHRRYRVTTLHYYQRPNGLLLADIYRKAETHTHHEYSQQSQLWKTFPSHKNPSKSPVEFSVEVGWNPQRSAALGLGEYEYVDCINRERAARSLRWLIKMRKFSQTRNEMYCRKDSRSGFTLLAVNTSGFQYI